ncbi:MATE family efflux transporter [Breznakiella homolactica]|uniref:Multidrug export protein MepA n=1 Tax=Breznakiella homolactica TaxID=2798577 RepID=A0A7T7XLU5_9SPIR|nr:MATE family efflux transporter [Breznakiella homolactica]QQO08760.1 MATE family efflux transporter [Breznakiella homolactica]
MAEVQTITKTSEANPLAQDFSAGSLLRFALPTICMMVFSGLYTTVDTVFVSRFVGTDALSSINIVTPVINVIVGLGTMLTAGGSAIVARKMGDRRNREARQDFTLIVFTAGLFGLVIAIVGLLFLEKIIRGLGASDRLLPYAAEYLSVLLAFSPANMLQVVFASFFVAAGRPGLGMGLGLAAGTVNGVLDFFFMGILGMGIRGAAIATGLGYTIPALGGMIFFLRNRTGILRFVRPRLRFRVLGESCVNGSSEMVSQLSAAVTTFLFNAAMMRRLGEDGVAAITIIIYSQFLLTTLYIGFSMGVSPVISYNYGSGNTGGLKRIFRICTGCITLFSLVIFVLSLCGGPCLAGFFSAEGTPVYLLARTGFRIVPFGFLLCGLNIFASALFTALSNGKVSAAISFLRTFGFLTIGIVALPLWIGDTGIWLAIPLAEFLTLVFSLFCVRRYRRVYKYY